MKKLLQILFCLLFSFAAFAQEKKDSLISNWAIGIAPGYLYTYPTYDSYPNNKNSSAGGIDIYIKYRASKYIYFTFGASYDMLGYEGSGYYPTIGGLYSEAFKYSIISLRALVDFNISVRKFNFSISPGIALGELIHNEYLLVFPPAFSPAPQKFDSTRTMIISASIVASIGYKLNNKITLFTEGQISEALNPIFYISESPDGPYYFSDYIKYYKISLGILYSL